MKAIINRRTGLEELAVIISTTLDEAGIVACSNRQITGRKKAPLSVRSSTV